MTKCNKARQLFSAYLDGEADEKERKYLEKHIEECEGCTKELEFTREMIFAARDIEDEELPIEFGDDLNTKLKAAGQKMKKSRFGIINSPQLKVASALAAGVLFILFIRGTVFDNAIKGDNTEQRIMSGRSLNETVKQNQKMDEGISALEKHNMENAPEGKGAGDFGVMGSIQETTGQRIIEITVSVKDIESSVSSLEEFAEENGAVFDDEKPYAQALPLTIHFTINSGKIDDLNSFLTDEFGNENVVFTSDEIKKPSITIDDLYRKLNEENSQIKDAGSKKDSEEVRRELLLEMINELETRRGSAEVTVVFRKNG